VRHPRRAQRLGLGAALLLVQVPFLFTGHVQEDAYIAFRCARNLATTGIYGFNAGQAVSASTSHLGVALAAAAHVVAGSGFIVLVQVLYCSATIAATWLIAQSLGDTDTGAERIWIIGALSPVSLLIGYSGLETGALLLATALLVRALARSRCSWSTWLAAAALPWIRPEAVAIGLIVVVAGSISGTLTRRDRTLLVLTILATSTAWLAFNRLYFGGYLTQTILAKALLSSPRNAGEAWTSGIARAGQLFVGRPDDPGMFVPIRSRYLAWLGGPASLVCLLAGAWLWRRAATISGPLLALLLIAFGLPLAYAAGGRVYPWYVWPSAWAGTLLVIAATVTWAEAPDTWPALRTAVRTAMLVLIPLGILGQLAFALSWGTQEQLYRGGIGRWLATIARQGDVILLEPAGYIPYFSGLTADDEIGLTSPRVTGYRRRDGAAWWPHFVRDVQPTFLIERGPMRDFITLDGYRLPASDQAWLTSHYTIVRTFTYEPDRLRHNGFTRAIARLGSAGDYIVYQRREETGE